MLDFEKVSLYSSNLDNNLDKNIIKKIRKEGIYKCCFNTDVINSTKNTFNIELPEVKIYDQKESYLCWIFAYISFIKPSICKKLNISDNDLDLSVNYIHFFDRLEKSNTLYEQVINNKLSYDNILNENFIDQYINTCGISENAKDIIQKYGIVPEKEMPMNTNIYNPFTFNKIFKEKIKKDILEILKLDNIQEKEALKDKLLEENYVILTKVFGKPPMKFNFNYVDNSKNKIKLENINPIEFFKICSLENMNNLIFVMNDSKKEYYKKYQYNYFNQMYNKQYYYYNIPIENIKKCIIQQLKERIPVWFGCDFSAVCGSYDNNVGILDSNLFDYKRNLGIEILNRSDREKFDCCNYHHAMIIVGVQIENNKPVRWKVQNSFGKENNKQGYFVMNDNFFNDYAVMFGINEKYMLDN